MVDEELKESVRELFYDKVAMESLSLPESEAGIEFSASEFPAKIDELCARNLPGHFTQVDLKVMPTASEIIDSLKTTEIEIAVTPEGNADSPVDHKYFAKPHLVRQTLQWLLDRIELRDENRHYYFQSQDDNLSELPHCPVPRKLDLPTNLLGEQQAANLWIGTEGTTSRLHSDNYDNIYVQISGTKRVYLMPPSSVLEVEEKMLVPATYNADMELVVDTPDPTTEVGGPGVLFPTYNPSQHPPKRPLYTIDLQPGDVLFLPALWYHQIEIVTPGPNISCNYWYTPFEDERKWAAWNFARQISRLL